MLTKMMFKKIAILLSAIVVAIFVNDGRQLYAQNNNPDLNNTEIIIEQLNKGITQVRDENASLKEINANINSRLQATTREFIRSSQELNNAQERLSTIEKNQIQPLKKNVEALESKIKKLESEKAALETRVAISEKSVSGQGESLKSLQDEYSKLNASLAQKEVKLKSQEEQIADLTAYKNRTQQKLIVQGKVVDVLEPENKDLKAQVNQLMDELNRKKSDLDITRQEVLRLKQANMPLEAKVAALEEKLNIVRQDENRAKNAITENVSLEARLKQAQDELNKQTALAGLLHTDKEKLNLEVAKLKPIAQGRDFGQLYDEARLQIAKLSEILARKDIEIEKSRKEIGAHKDKIFELQSRMGELEKNIALSEKTFGKAGELEAKALSLEAQLKDKSGLADSLQKNIVELSQQLAKKEQEKKDIELRFAKIDSEKYDLQKELSVNKARLDEISVVYDSLKSQVSQLSNLLTQKELELGQKRKEAVALTDEIATLKGSQAEMEKKVSDTKYRQKKTLDDLAQAVRLNSALQDRILDVSQSLENPQYSAESKQKAEELKKEIEKMLESDKQ